MFCLCVLNVHFGLLLLLTLKPLNFFLDVLFVKHYDVLVRQRGAIVKLKIVFRILAKVFWLISKVLLNGSISVRAGNHANKFVELCHKLGVSVQSFSIILPCSSGIFVWLLSNLLDENLSLLEELVIPVTVEVPEPAILVLLVLVNPELFPGLEDNGMAE